MLIQVVGRIQFLVVLGLRFPFSCQLLVRILSRLLKAVCISSHMAFFIFTPSNSTSSLSHSLNLSDLPVCLLLLPPFSTSWRSFSTSQDSCDYIRLPFLITSLYNLSFLSQLCHFTQHNHRSDISSYSQALGIWGHEILGPLVKILSITLSIHDSCLNDVLQGWVQNGDVLIYHFFFVLVGALL